ncbi:hypothetical protein MKleb_5880 (plasmid) [Klebsiella sp. PL-2018]|nr:hypothetical protein MKleb_5880 [Klebsiella sp. PL-2018]
MRSSLSSALSIFFDVRFHAGIRAAVPDTVGVGLPVVTEFVPALCAAIGHMQSQKVMLSDTLLMIEVGG